MDRGPTAVWRYAETDMETFASDFDKRREEANSPMAEDTKGLTTQIGMVESISPARANVRGIFFLLFHQRHYIIDPLLFFSSYRMTNMSIYGILVALIVGAIGGYLLASSTSTVPQKETAKDKSSVTQTRSTPPKTNEEKIANAVSAAPEKIAEGAVVLDWPGADGTMAELRKGTNGWTCLPDYPASPGNDPLCGDAMTMQWFQSYMQHKPPKLAQAGISYMLQGASDASNSDPFAAAPPKGMDWMSAGPHIMIFSAGDLDEKLYGTEPGDKPWVMFAGTPYEHLMVPVK